MTKKQFAVITRSLAAQLPGFASKGQLLVGLPLEHTLKGVFLDSSSFDSDLFFVQVFMQPLFVPARHLVFNVGWRVGGGGHRWDNRDPELLEKLRAALASEPCSFLDRARTPTDVAAAASSLGKSQDPYVQQTIAFAFAQAGQRVRAVKELDGLIALLNEDVAWQREMSERAKQLKKQIANDPAAAGRLLHGWETETPRALNLEEFRSVVTG